MRSESAPMPNLARLIDVVFADLPLEQRAWLWALTDPDLSPDTATGEALNQWLALYGIPPQQEGETDEQVRERMRAAWLPRTKVS